MKAGELYIVKSDKTGEYLGHDRKMVPFLRDASVFTLFDALKVAKEDDNWVYASLNIECLDLLRKGMYGE
jgi:hypothetical protein